MTLPLTVPPKHGHKSFLFSELCTDLDRLEAVWKILKAGALPLIIGGDHAIPIPVMLKWITDSE